MTISARSPMDIPPPPKKDNIFSRLRREMEAEREREKAQKILPSTA